MRRNANKNTYCETIPYLNFGNLNPIKIENLKASKTYEYTIEFWTYVYSYNPIELNFKEFYIEWNLHNKITIYNEGTTGRVKCHCLFDKDKSSSIFPDNKVQSIQYYRWQHIKCGTDGLNKKYFLNTIFGTISANPSNFPNFDDADLKSSLNIYKSSNFLVNFGYIFIREIKLWQQYNAQYIETGYLDMGDTNFITNFPGLLAYFKNEYDATNIFEDRMKIVENIANEITKVSFLVTDYTGYNIISPDDSAFDPSLTQLCPNEQFWDTIECKEIDKTLIPANCLQIGTQRNDCVLCEAQYYIDTNNGNCVDVCPDKYYGLDLINQCRPCDPTCFHCTGRLFNQCIDCDGAYYFNVEKNTCVLDCVPEGMVPSNTQPNKCVYFDATATLINVSELDPIDISTFHHIEAEISGATSSGFTHQWGIEVTETNTLNSDLGFIDPLLPTDTPFNGDISLLNTPIDNTILKLGHKYVLYLDIIMAGATVPLDKVTVRQKWTGTMNAAPTNGTMKVMPGSGFLNATVYIFTCYHFYDETTVNDDGGYKFYYKERGAILEIAITNDWSKSNMAYMKFESVGFPEESTIIDVYCKVKDEYGAENYATNSIVVIRNYDSQLYDGSAMMDTFDLDFDVRFKEENYGARSLFLNSVGFNPPRPIRPDLLYTVYDNNLDGTEVVANDPNCVENFCNSKGVCGLIDTAIACNCELGEVGRNCHIKKDAYEKVADKYNNLFATMYEEVKKDGMSDNYYQSFYNLFVSAKNFFQNTIFFTNSLDTYVKFGMSTQKNFIKDNDIDDSKLNKFMELFFFWFDYFYIRLAQNKIKGQISNNSGDRNFPLQLSEQNIYHKDFNQLTSLMSKELAKFIIDLNKDTYSFISNHFKYHIRMINENFNDEEFFKSITDKEYASSIYFMDCLKYSQSKQNLNTFSYALLYIEYLQNPHSYESVYYKNITSPFITLKILNKQSGTEIMINDCDIEAHPVIMKLPFNSYEYLSYINRQKFLFDPNNYILPSDPMFRDPIYIADNGFVSNDTIDKRIEKYNRENNFTMLYYLSAARSTGSYVINNDMKFINYTEKNNYIIIHGNGLGSFTTMFTPNNDEFIVDGRLFYYKKYMVLAYWPNYAKNSAFLLIASLTGAFILLVIFYSIFDAAYFKKKSHLEFLKREIVKSQLAYAPKNNEAMINEIVPEFGGGEELQAKKNEIKHMFDNVNFDDGDDQGSNGNHNSKSARASNMVLSDNNFSNVKNEGVKEEDDYNSNISGAANPPKKKYIKSKKKKKEVTMQNTNADANTIENFPKGKIKTTANFNTTTIHSNFVNDKNSAQIKIEEKNKMNYFMDNEQTRPDLISIKKFHNRDIEFKGDALPEDFDNEADEKRKNLEAYSNIPGTTGAFIWYNIIHRHLILNPIGNVSIFNPRWKKFVLYLGQSMLSMLIITFICTFFDTLTIANAGTCIGWGILISILVNLLMYGLVFFFGTSKYQRRRMFDFVVQGKQLAIISAWKDLEKSNTCYTIIGMVIIVIIFAANYYFSIIFVAVWFDQANGWILCAGISILFDVLVFEILIELVIGLGFSLRKKGWCLRNFGEWMNRTRNYRTLWP